MPLLGLWESVVRRRYFLESRADEIHRVVCADGVRVAIKRFLPPPGVPRRDTPILCIPGLGADSHNYDAPGEQGLGPHFASMGFDTWAIDLRGTGLSTIAPELWSDVSFDTFATLDVPAFVDHVVKHTGSPRVFGLGHSMGGMLWYAHLGRTNDRRVAALCAIASPLGFPQGWEVAPIFRPVWWLGEHVPGLHAGTFLRWASPLAMRRFDRASKRFANVENIDPVYCRRLLHAAVDSIPRGVLLQFRDWVMNDTFRSCDGTIDYRERLRAVATPVCVIAGNVDKLARLDSVRRAVDLLPDAELVLCSRATGFSTDYGHIDIVFGHDAPREVFPHMVRFFETHDAEPALDSPGPDAARVH